MNGLSEFTPSGYRRAHTALWRFPTGERMRSGRASAAGYLQEKQIACMPMQLADSSSSSESVFLPHLDDVQAHHSASSVSLPAFLRGSRKTAPQSFGCKFLLNRTLTELPNSIASLSTSTVSQDQPHRPLTSSSNQQSTSGNKIPWYLALLHEKEQCLLMLGEEINRLSVFEAESTRKDGVISTLRDDIAELQKQLSLLSNADDIKTQEKIILKLEDEVNRLKVFEQESIRKDNLIADLREEVDCLTLQLNQMGPVLNTDSPALTTILSRLFMDNEIKVTKLDDEISENGYVKEESEEEGTFKAEQEQMEKELVQADLKYLEARNQELTEELEKLKRDYNFSTGTVSSLQREVAYQMSQLRKAESEEERLRKELRERECQLQAMSNKFSSLREERKCDEIMAEIEKENSGLWQLVSEMKSELEQRNKLISELKTEVHRLQLELYAEREQAKRFQSERTEMHVKTNALQQTLQQTKVALESTQARFDRFHSKIFQATYCATGAKPLQTEISDGEIMDLMQKIINDRMEFHQLLKQKGENVPPLFFNEAQDKSKSPKKNGK
ncbi:coiled-coil domain-containing protein 27 isoform X2 [Protopterus annectens]|uniref:coiled-coil domain-containing protein 27 isoform X2 n=1 Tax=Protopterus annectens TaxID=7888 RepID=UPI001CFAEC92|nr:coiled-coil domain-containing protein 27 isoform X2 [Protopterus annectens]